MTELARVQAELAQAKAQLWQRERLLENTEQGIWYLDGSGLTVFVNPAMCRLLGREQVEVMGHSVFEFFSGPDLVTLNNQLERRKQGHKTGYEIGLVRPDGTRVECFNNATPIHDAAGTRLGSVGMWTDLTPMKQAQRKLDAALADSEARRAEYEALLGSFPGFIAVVDQDGRYVYVNQAQAGLFGRPAAEVIGRTVVEMRGPERAAQLISEFPRLRAGEVISDITERPARGGRPAVSLRVNRVAGPPGAEGRQLFYAFGIDITDILKGEARSNFLARMSHEIRTPMNAIIGLTAATLATELKPQQHDYLSRVHMAGHELMELLDQVLDLSKIDVGKLQLESIAFDLQGLLQGTLAVLTQLLQSKGLSLRMSCPPEVPRQLLGDPMRLRQVLTNLISNARKFTEQGDIVVSVHTVSAPEAPLLLRFSVSDTGLGMTRAQLASLFQPYVQADASISRQFGGTGLGLAISRELVELMGGRIWAHSEPGQGSTFSFELPFTRDTKAAGAQIRANDTPNLWPLLDDSALAAIQGARILLVEDNAVNQLVAVELLKHAQVEVTVANNGQEALDRLAQGPFDCVLMDLEMPVMDGYTATAHIRANPAWAGLPVLAMSASVLPEERARAERAGTNGHIAKPVMPQVLFAALLRWVPVGRRVAGLG
jgi:two-component system sensor histidine kinase/response regulator